MPRAIGGSCMRFLDHGTQEEDGLRPGAALRVRLSIALLEVRIELGPREVVRLAVPWICRLHVRVVHVLPLLVFTERSDLCPRLRLQCFICNGSIMERSAVRRRRRLLAREAAQSQGVWLECSNANSLVLQRCEVRRRRRLLLCQATQSHGVCRVKANRARPLANTATEISDACMHLAQAMDQ